MTGFETRWTLLDDYGAMHVSMSRKLRKADFVLSSQCS